MDRHFKTNQIYLKDVSFQAPMGAAAFAQEWSPKVQVDVKIEPELIHDAFYEVALSISVVSRTGTNTHYVVEIVQCGVFTVRGYDEVEASRILRTICPEILYPFAREAVESLVVKARFPSLLLDPIDFAASYVA